MRSSGTMLPPQLTSARAARDSRHGSLSCCFADRRNVAGFYAFAHRTLVKQKFLQEMIMKSVVLWLLGVPLTVVVLLNVFNVI